MSERPLDDDEFIIVRDDKGKFVLAPHTRLVQSYEEAMKRGATRLRLKIVRE